MRREHGQFSTHDGLQLFTQCWLPQRTPQANLVMVHGIGEHSGRYANFAEWFTPQGYAVYAFDHRGHGKSPGLKGHVAHWSDFREDVGAFLNHVKRQEADSPLFLIGHSMGGLIVLDYGLHGDVTGLKGVVASGPALGSAEKLSPIQRILIRILSPILPKVQLDNGLDVNGLARDPEVIRLYRQDPLVHPKITPCLASEMFQTADNCMRHAKDWPANLPLFIVHGGADAICPPQASARFFADVTANNKLRREYEDYLHEVFNEIGREAVLQDVQDWLEKLLN
ncbi:MAG: lysophospholipase [Anaerolineae bacterium]|nr:lysophospholipase [Anaerolineae bacterium]